MVVLSVFWWCSFPIQIHGYILNILQKQWIHFIVISAFTLVEIAMAALKKTIVLSWWYQAPDIMCVAWIHLDANFGCFNPQCCFAITTCLHPLCVRPQFPVFALQIASTQLYFSNIFKYIIHWAVLFLKSMFFLLGNLPYFTPAAPSIVLRGKKPWTTWALNLMRRR